MLKDKVMEEKDEYVIGIQESFFQGSHKIPNIDDQNIYHECK